jgi:hypothetical protein
MVLVEYCTRSSYKNGNENKLGRGCRVEGGKSWGETNGLQYGIRNLAMKSLMNNDML